MTSPVHGTRSASPRRIPRLIAVLLAVTLASPVIAQSVGRIEYLEGDVTLVRDGRIRDAFDIQLGEAVLQFDVIQTGFDGYVELALERPGQGTVRIRENSAYYIELDEREGGRVRLLTGAIEIAVDSLATGRRLDVQTQSAVLGVRGTTFDVLTAPDDSTLLGVREGRVAIAAAGSELIAQAGSAAETVEGRPPQVEAVPGGAFESFYASWTQTRLQAFRNGAPTFIRAYARRYLDTRETFENAYRDLISYRSDLQAALSGTPNRGRDMRLRSAMSPALIRMRSVLPLFEETVYRLEELSRFHTQGIGRTTIGATPSAQFFRTFDRERTQLVRQLAEVRTIFRLYRELEAQSGGSGIESPFGGGSLLDSMEF